MENAKSTTRPVPCLALVVPCYNEQETLPTTIDALDVLMADCRRRGLIRENSFVCYVDDGSRDATWQILVNRHMRDTSCRAVKFAANAGHQNAVWAGMTECRKWGADCIISLDADLQDDISVIPQMLAEYVNGCDIVYGVRSNRSTDTAFKRDTAHLFYKLMAHLNVAIVPDHADYRLVSRRVLKILSSFHEQSLFLRGLFPILGFKTAKVYYSRLSRTAGISKYPLRKMLSFAWRGITSCSTAPLRTAGIMSFACMIIAFLTCLVSLYKYCMGETIQGWTSLMIIILLLGSAQLFCLAVIGEYIAKIFTEVRRRPRYIIEETLQ